MNFLNTMASRKGWIENELVASDFGGIKYD